MNSSAVLTQFKVNRHLASTRRVIAGFDGFVDRIVVPVALRHGPGENFTPIATIPEFAQRMQNAAGRSTNIELHQRMEKLGGNGPIMSNALMAFGTSLKYIGALGSQHPVPALSDFAKHSKAITLCDPGLTTALEFTDGKLMLGLMSGFDELTYERIIERVGSEDAMRSFVAEAHLVSLVNWTMLPHMTAIFRAFVDRLLPSIPKRDGRIFFFDLADPEKRGDSELQTALDVVSDFEKFGSVTLGLNLKEAEHVARILEIPSSGESEQSLRSLANAIREKLRLSVVVVHPRKSAACATANGTYWKPGPYCERPLVTTGAGDHFNAGFALGQLIGLNPEGCLATGVGTSGLYVRTGASPTLDHLETFLYC
ncbi:MAG: PfkB family carbohydrate kinase [Nibricoccus sp.]